MRLTRQQVIARLASTCWVLVLVTIVIGPLSLAISPRKDDLFFALGAALSLGAGIALRTGSRGGAALGVGIGCLAGLAAAIIAGNISGRGIAVLVPPVVSLCIGFMEGIEPPRNRSRGEVIVTSVIIGAVIGAGMSVALNWPALLGAVITGLLVGIASSTRAESSAGAPGRFRSPSIVMLAAAVLSIALVTALAWQEMKWFAFPSVMLFAFLVPMLCYFMGRAAARWLRPRVEVYNDLIGYLRAMSVPMGGFALGYLALIVVFTGFYGSLHRWSPHAFSTTGPVSIIDWLFFSLFTATGQESSGISPASGWARLLVSLETILCLAWIVVVFAAVMAYLQPRLERLASIGETDRTP